MHRNTPLRNPRASTSDLLTWPETPPTESSPVVSSTGHRSHQPSDKMSEVLGGRKLTNEEESLPKMKPSSGSKLREMNGSGIFSANAEDTASQANSKDRTSIRTYQQTKTGNSQVSFSTEGNISSMKPTSIAEAAKQRELGGTLHEPDSKNKKQASNAKTKELSGTDIFGPAPEILPRPSAAARILELKECTEMAEPVRRNARTSMKVSEPDDDSVKKTAKKIHDQKFADLTGNNIFKGDVPPAGSAEKPLSSAKLREMSGSDIFAVGKAEETRDFTRGSRKPPGGVSTIALI